MATERVNVSIADDYLDRFDDVVKQLKKAGLKVGHTLEAIGVITGSIDADKVPHLKQVKGVAAVEYDREVRATPDD